MDGHTTVLNLYEFPWAVILKGSAYSFPVLRTVQEFRTGSFIVSGRNTYPAIGIILATVVINRNSVLHSYDLHFDYV
ncbi:MAG: hypothetical protein K9W43_14245 [Candidatus Thorarchaeota archaeon]|nr:hypothetical protein [Candidatus Thorarchaeota archaeon]